MDNYFMEMALELSLNGKGMVNPNPLVGAVIVKDGRVIGSGYHERYGKEHAEVNAINNASESVCGATLYVTLEPCCHYGKTPPCTKKIINSKIARVVVGMVDPNSLVAGKGIRSLEEAGIEVTVGVLSERCKKLNEVFIKYITKKSPFVVLKGAMSLDGKIATKTGDSKWISSEASRNMVQKLRSELASIMVGVDTVINDDPRLNCRIVGCRNPEKIVVDTRLRIPINSKIVQAAMDERLIVATTELADNDKVRELLELGVIVIFVSLKNGRVNLKELMLKLYDMKIDSVLLEGGATLNYSALDEGIVDKVMIYVAPKFIGGSEAKGVVGGEGVLSLKDAFMIRDLSVIKTSEDVLIEGYIDGGE